MNTTGETTTLTPMVLRDLTTLRVGGPATHCVTVTDADELVEAVTNADQAGEPVLLVAGGSNLLVGDSGFEGMVVVVRGRGIGVVSEDACSGVTVRVQAGHPWDDLVARAVGEGWVGIEALSGIPGSVGATPIQNVGAYGQEVAQTIAQVRTWDRHEHRQRTFAASECGFGYRHSRFKADPGRYLVLDVTFQFVHGTLSAPIGYTELARSLDTPLRSKAPMTDVRDHVLALRRAKGMVLDAADHDTWSAGSFFTNPILAADTALPEGAPRFPVSGRDDQVKTSAAWLIEHAGFGKGFAVGPRASLSTKHTLALTNRGEATAQDLLELARAVRDGVRDRFGITLVNEPVLVGEQL
ncbi:MAG: UDP-N-acetylmuramate dehydrogenase [Actinomycetales bacterium]